MFPDKREFEHFTRVLKEVQQSLSTKDATKLKELSNNTINTASTLQDSASITMAVIVYALSKMVERGDYQRIKNWDLFVKKFNALLDLAIKCISENDAEKCTDYMQRARSLVESQSVNLKPYIQDVLKKASINKGSRIYEHGISLEQTSKLLGITQWELSDYIGSRTADSNQTNTLDVKKRAKMALEFFS